MKLFRRVRTRNGLMTSLVKLGTPLYLAQTLIQGTVPLVGGLLGGSVGAAAAVHTLTVEALVGRCLPRLTPTSYPNGGLRQESSRAPLMATPSGARSPTDFRLTPARPSPAARSGGRALDQGRRRY